MLAVYITQALGSDLKGLLKSSKKFQKNLKKALDKQKTLC